MNTQNWKYSETMIDQNTNQAYPLYTPEGQPLDEMPSAHDTKNWEIVQENRANGWEIGIAPANEQGQVWVLAIYTDPYTGHEIMAMAWVSSNWQYESAQILK